MKSKLTWVMLVLLLTGGVGGSVVLSKAFRYDARQIWETDVSQAARWLSGTTLGWLEESYAPLSGLAILFKNSQNVSEDEFLGAVDALEARATAFFLDTLAVVRQKGGKGKWVVEFSNDPFGPLPADEPLDKSQQILDIIKVTAARPEQMILGAPLKTEDSAVYSPIALAVKDAQGPLVVLGLLNFKALTEGLFDIHKPEGLQLHIQGRFLKQDGPGPLQNVIGGPTNDTLYTVTTRTVSAGADLSISWCANAQFSGGPQEGLANLILIGGLAGAILVMLFIGLLFKQNLSITRKVTEATAELAENQRRLDLALASSGIGIWDWDIVTNTITWDDAQHRIMGTDPADGSPDFETFSKMIHPEDAEAVSSSTNEALEGRTDYMSVYRFLRPDGEVRTIKSRGDVIRDTDGRALRMIGTSEDITESRAAEEQLRKLSKAVEQSPASVVITDRKGNIEYVNSRFCEVTGYSADEAVGLNPRVLKSGKTPPEVHEQLWKTISAGEEWRGELINKKKNGEIYWESASILPIINDAGSIQFYLAVKQDITERIQAEGEIQRQKEFLETTLNSLAHPFYVIDAEDYSIVLMNESARKRGAEGATTCHALTHRRDTPCDGQKDPCPLEQMKQMKAPVVVEHQHYDREGNETIAEVHGYPIIDSEGNVVQMIEYSLDITDRKEAEEELRKRSVELEQFNNAMVGREKRIIEVKTEVNRLCRELGRPEPYTQSTEQVQQTDSTPDSAEQAGLRPNETNKKAEAIEGADSRIKSVSEVQTDDPEELTFANLFDLDEIQVVQDAFSMATGVASIITTPDGAPITKPSNFCRLCNDIIRKTEKGLANCMSSDAEIGRYNPDGPIVQPCLSGGLWDGGASVSVNNRHIANWLVGQVRNDKLDIEQMLAYAKEIGADEKAFEEALNEAPVMSLEQFTAVCDTLFLVAKQMSKAAFQNLQQKRIIAEREEIENEREVLLGGLEERVRVRTSEADDSRLAALSLMDDAEAERRRTESALEKLKLSEQDLQARVKDLDEAQLAMLNMMEDLDEEKQNAEGATRAKSDFLANMSHEIRTPMNAVIGMTHLALQTELTRKQEDYLKKIRLSANNLLGIINDILDFSKIEAGKLDMESVDFGLDEVLDNVATVVGVKAQEKELELLIDTGLDVPMALVGDSLRLGQVLINLCNNAVKFTEKGQIIVSAKLINKKDGQAQLRFSVRDSGIGMTQEQIGKLFQAFNQADTSTTRKYGGTGLGLTISKRLVEMMNGEIWVESEPGEGSEFIFTATFGLARELKRRRLEPSPDLRGMRVLVVDDNESSREILQGLLESMSFDVSVAASGEEGIEELERVSADKPYMLVIMDWKMSGMDGVTASKKIRNSELGIRNTKIIMVTAYGREEVMRMSEKAGIDGFLIKPVSQSMLFDAIMQIFGKHVEREDRAAKGKGLAAGALKEIRGARILLVEDNEINQDVAREILEQAGLVVKIASDGKEGSEKVQTEKFDVVLMDIQMPVMDGFEATARIRELEADQSTINNHQSPIPIIAMTAHAMAGDREKSIEGGMNDHVTKPIDPDELFGALVKWIKPRKQDAQTAETELAQNLLENEREEEAEADILPSEVPGISIKTGLTRVGGNQRFYRKLLGKFLKSNANAVEDIKDALDKGDTETAARLAHSVKGVAGNLGAKDLFPVAAELEKGIKQGETDLLDSLIENFASHLNVVIEGIRVLEENEKTRKKEEAPTDETPIDVDAVKPLLQEMAQILEIDIMGARNRLEALGLHLDHSVVWDQFNRLRKCVEGFDMDGAKDSLSEISDVLEITLE